MVASGIAFLLSSVGVSVSIPFIAGQWSLLSASFSATPVLAHVSIPFIAGQWSLHSFLKGKGIAFLLFQSPSLRGSGRFRWFHILEKEEKNVFQSPSLRGSGRFLRIRYIVQGVGSLVSIPFIAGQWSLR